METKDLSQLVKKLQEKKIEPLEIAKYFLESYLQNEPLNLVRFRDVYLCMFLQNNEEFNKAWCTIHDNLYHVSCIADDIQRTNHVGVGQLMLPEGYMAADIAKHFRNVFNYEPSSS